MIYPQININGTSRQSLIEQYANAHYALEKAIDEIQKNVEVNGRDYQIRPEEYKLAREQHIEILQSLNHASKYFIQIAIKLQEESC